MGNENSEGLQSARHFAGFVCEGVGVEVQKMQLEVGAVRPWRRRGKPKRLGLEWGGLKRELPGGGSQVGVLETGPDVSEVCDIDSPLSAL